MGKLKQQMIEDMKLRNFSPKTIRTYVASVSAYIRYFNCPAEELSDQQIKEYLLYLLKNGASWSTINAAQSGLKQLYVNILKQGWKVERLQRPKRDKKLPQVLSVEEVESIINSAGNIKHKVILLTLYATGVRLGELCKLKISAIDSKRMLIKVVQGKGKKDRNTILSEKLLGMLRLYYKKYRPEEYLFNGHHQGKPISERTVQHIFRKSAERANIKREASVHTLRHSFATHLLEKGVDIFTISKLLGHTNIKTTTVYLHLQNSQMGSIPNPLDHLDIKI